VATLPRTSCTWLSTAQGAIRPLPGARSTTFGALLPRHSVGRRGYSNWSTTSGLSWAISTVGSMSTIFATDGVPSASKTNSM
jgi:hypothetical protein